MRYKLLFINFNITGLSHFVGNYFALSPYKSTFRKETHEFKTADRA